MRKLGILAGVALVAAFAVSSAWAQQPQGQRVAGTIEKVDGNTVIVKSKDGAAQTVALTDKALIVAVHKASLADIKEGSYVGSGAVPQADGSQKAVEVHIFAESMRGTGDGHRDNWPGAPNGTMTNGAAGSPVTGVDGLTMMVKYKDGEKKIIVTPTTPIVRFEVSDKGVLKPGAAVTVPAATKKPDGTFETARINVGLDGVVPN
jgi:outer membrane lipoprotein SlyB